MVDPSYKENFWGRSGREKKKIEENQTENLQVRPADIWVIQANVLVMGQPVTSEWPR